MHVCSTARHHLESFALFILLAIMLPAVAQAPHALTAGDTQRIEELIHKMTLEQKLDYIGGTGFAIRGVPSLNLPVLEMSDGPYGTRSNVSFPSTTYAAGIGLAASWDRDLALRVGGAIGRDARARGVHFMLGPGVNIYRSPRNGRNFEYFGEDPFLSAAITTGYITGMQAQGVSATIKHFLGNNSEFLRHDSDSVIDERALREIYLSAFEAAVNVAHVGAIMDSYNLVNGAHATQNATFNTEIVRKEWKFPGVIMSDWDATYDAVGAANGGLDLEMPNGKFMNRTNLQPAIKSGSVSEATIDEKVRHILATAAAFNWLDRPQLDSTISVIDARNDGTALDSARESAVLLKNSGALLPLSTVQIKSILVVGPDAYPGVPVGGGSAGVVPFHTVSALEGIANLVGRSVTVLYDRGLPTLSELARMTSFTTQAVGGKPGLALDQFAADDLSGSPGGSYTVQHIDRSGSGRGGLLDNPAAAAMLYAPGNRRSSARYSGFYTAATAGRYIVALDSSAEGSGNRVFLDGKLIIDDWALVLAIQPQVTVELSAGAHQVVIEERQGGLGGRFRFAIVAEDKIVNSRARELAPKADVVLVSAGFQGDSESEGGDRTFALPFGQDALIAAMAAANPKTIVAVTSGGNVDSSAWIEHVPALLQTWYSGQEGGRALAEILFGDVNPSGHLPVTFERRAEDNPTFANYYPECSSKHIDYKEGIFVGYRGYERNQVKPLFPFGYGLSYTTFQFANLKATAGANAEVVVSFDVTNTGQRKGAEIAQVYVSEDGAKIPRPARELKGFERVELAPGLTEHVSVTLGLRAFAHYDAAGKKWTMDPGKYTLQVGDSEESTPLQAAIEFSAKQVASMK